MKRERRHGPRDQEPSVFSSILLRLCDASAALAAALVDAEGETVDYAGSLSPYEARIAAAEWRIVLSVLGRTPAPWSATHEMVVRARARSYAILGLDDGYALVLILPRGAFAVSRRALSEAAEALEHEAGLRPGGIAAHEKVRWSFVSVRSAPADPQRPESVWHDGAWRPVTILGRFQSGAPREVGYLARLSSGPELFVVREPLGKWFLGRPV